MGISLLFFIKGKWLFVVVAVGVLVWKQIKISDLQNETAETKKGTLESYSGGVDNNYNLIRILLAWGVLYSHSFTLSATQAEGWFDQNVGKELGSVAVNVFFIISGFLISKSFVRRQDVVQFMKARIFRIIPALAGVVILSVAVLGPVVTSLSAKEYFSEKDTWDYLYKNIILTHVEYKLPGVFEKHQNSAVNGSLWSIIYEMRMYLVIVLVGCLGCLTKQKNALALMFLFLAWHFAALLIPQLETGQLHRVSIYFFMGYVFQQFERRIPLNFIFIIPLGVIAYFFKDLIIGHFLEALFFAYAVFYLAYIPGGFLRNYNNLGDYSYGFYVYAFPVQQSLYHFVPNITFLEMLIYASLITSVFAVLSWHYIEKPALKLAKRFSLKMPKESEL